MEFDRDLYQKAFSRIALSDKKREEILHMSEQKEKRRKPIGRRMLVAAVTALLAAILAMGANAATDGGLGEQFVKLVDSVTFKDGTEVKIYTEDGVQVGEQQITIKDIAGEQSDHRVVIKYSDIEVTPGNGYVFEYTPGATEEAAESDSQQVKYTKITPVEYTSGVLSKVEVEVTPDQVGTPVPVITVHNNGEETTLKITDDEGKDHYYTAYLVGDEESETQPDAGKSVSVTVSTAN